MCTSSRCAQLSMSSSRSTTRWSEKAPNGGNLTPPTTPNLQQCQIVSTKHLRVTRHSRAFRTLWGMIPSSGRKAKYAPPKHVVSRILGCHYNTWQSSVSPERRVEACQTCEVTPKHRAQGNAGVEVASNPVVSSVEAHGMHAHEDLARFQSGNWQGLQPRIVVNTVSRSRRWRRTQDEGFRGAR